MMIETRGLTVLYGSTLALDRVSIKVEKGKLVSIIGANGAGKSTLLNTISGLVHPQGGEIYTDGREVSKFPPQVMVRMGLSLVPQGRQLFGPMTVYENLLMGAYWRREKEIEKELEKVFHIFPILGERKRQRSSTLSGGEGQMLAIARALMSNPKYLLLDEPSLGLAPQVARQIFSKLAELKEQGTTILLVEQNARAALKLSDYCYLMELGRVTLEGTPEEIAKDERVKRAYLGK